MWKVDSILRSILSGMLFLCKTIFLMIKKAFLSFVIYYIYYYYFVKEKELLLFTNTNS